MVTKTRLATDVPYTYYTYDDSRGKHTTYTGKWTRGEESITYQSGSRSPSGHWPWKECVHTTSGVRNAIAGSNGYTMYWPSERYSRNVSVTWAPTLDTPRLPSGTWDESVVKKLLDQLDLNSQENVLLYSGVLQAIPLVGSAFKLTSILNRAAKNLSKSFRKKPFTTVVKSLISMDFVDRFVISPTIDDARRFATATNHVLNVIQTARERSAHRFALQSASTDVVSRKESTGSAAVTGDCPGFKYRKVVEQTATSKAFMLLEASYDMMAVDPLKVWAQRVGLTRPLDSMWDLVPFSFVIDYFTRAGDFISHLSDEMSSVDGLKGRITRILDLWGTHELRGSCSITATDTYGGPFVPSGVVYTPWKELGTATSTVAKFHRFRVPDPWTLISSLSGQKEDYLSINLDLSSTRKRTLVELFIQMRL